MDNFEYVYENYKDVFEQKEEAIKKYAPTNKDVTLIAVSKNFEIEKINVLVKKGVKDFGESKVQEFLPKYEYFKEFNINWHFIGRLQKNKVKYIVDKVAYIHSVDSMELAEVINKECTKKGVVVKIFLQVNVGEDGNKQGFSYNDFPKALEILKNMKNIEVVGFMTILPILDDANAVDNFYHKMYELLLDNSSFFIHNRHKACLSMGMSDDYNIAIKNNANFIRVGTAIFGNRYL
ncbi:MAG: YggS family pyridoxal phosphate-dependent enzyme [Lachnospirales bacterium]